jgi:hypothetical protein
MSEVQVEAQGEDVQAHENTTQENTLPTPQQDITQYQQSTITESVEPNVVVLIHLPDINRDVEIGRYVVKSAWIKADISPANKSIVYKLTLSCNGIEHSFKALSIFIEFKDKVVFKLTR